MAKCLTKRECDRLVPGTWIRTMWDDCGAKDGVVVEVNKESKWVVTLFPGEKYFTTLCYDQIVKKGDMISAKDSGL